MCPVKSGEVSRRSRKPKDEDEDDEDFEDDYQPTASTRRSTRARKSSKPEEESPKPVKKAVTGKRKAETPAKRQPQPKKAKKASPAKKPVLKKKKDDDEKEGKPNEDEAEASFAEDSDGEEDIDYDQEDTDLKGEENEKDSGARRFTSRSRKTPERFHFDGETILQPKGGEDDDEDDFLEEMEEEEEEEEEEQPEEPKEEKTENGVWKKNDSMFFFEHNKFKPAKKIISFDFDCTLANTKGKHIFPKTENDWVHWCAKEKMVEKFNKLMPTENNAPDYCFVIFSNQLGVTKGQADWDVVRKRIDNFIKDVNVPFNVICAIESDSNRKPDTGMFSFFLEKLNGEFNSVEKIDMANSVFVGDAAGRKAGWNGQSKTKKDFSCADRKFALNLGLPFKTPEEFFLDQAPTDQFDLGFDPKSIADATSDKPKVDEYTSAKQEMIICVGRPACGKSFFVHKYLANPELKSAVEYVRINRDTLITQVKCLKEARKALEEKKSVVIDNTNPSKKVRAEYIELAQEFNVPVRCFNFKTEQLLADHLNNVRFKVSGTKPVPPVAIGNFKKQFEEPIKSEGFEEVVDIQWEPKFTDDKLKQAFYRFYD